MKFVAVTYGTEGDTRPLAELCRALMDAGHEARLLADISTLEFAHALRVPAAALSGDIRQALRPGEALSFAVRKRAGVTGTASALARIANANTAAWMREVAAASEGCDAIIVSGLAAFVGFSVAEHRGVKAIGTGLIPITPTAEFPSPFLRPGALPGWLNRTSHRLVNGLLWRAFRKATNAARASVCGLAPRKAVWDSHPMLYGVSRVLLPRPMDWPDNAHVCGQWTLPPPNWSPPQDLTDFLSAGEPPLYVGFGSMAGFDGGELLSEIVAAVAGRRALFYSGWSGMDGSGLPANFFPVGETPHGWLFPKISLAIHHGGAGTSHSAVRAGIPSVVIPFAGDQFFWADRLRRAGVAAVPARRRHLRASEVADGIAFAESVGARSRAKSLGSEMAAEDGLANAVSLIERL